MCAMDSHGKSFASASKTTAKGTNGLGKISGMDNNQRCSKGCNMFHINRTNFTCLHYRMINCVQLGYKFILMYYKLLLYAFVQGRIYLFLNMSICIYQTISALNKYTVIVKINFFYIRNNTSYRFSRNSLYAYFGVD